jgi:hypothetical protein
MSVVPKLAANKVLRLSNIKPIKAFRKQNIYPIHVTKMGCRNRPDCYRDNDLLITSQLLPACRQVPAELRRLLLLNEGQK